MLDDLRTYLQLASGITEATTSKAREVASGLVAQGLSLSNRAMPAPEMVGQVQELADDLVATSRSNRELLVGMIRAEVDRAVGRMGFVREDELAALRRHVQRLEKQLTDLEAQAPPAAEPAAPEPAAPEEATTPASTAPPAKKKRILVVDEPGADA